MTFTSVLVHLQSVGKQGKLGDQLNKIRHPFPIRDYPSLLSLFEGGLNQAR